MTIGLAAWLVLAAAFFAAGILAAAVRHDRGGILAGLLLLLAGCAVALASLVRYAVLPPTALATLLLVLVLGGVLSLVIESLHDGPAGTDEEAP